MPAEGWERIYREKGDLQFPVLPKVRRAANTFKEKHYHKILDLGCGTGKHSIFLARKGFSVYATDMSATGINIARKKAKSLCLDDIHFFQHDMRSIPFSDNFFDAVLCIWTIYHGTLDQIVNTIADIHRVLKTNGTFLTDFKSTEDTTCGIGQEIEMNTFIGDKEEEEDIPHHYVTRQELTRLFAEFRRLRIRAFTRIYRDEKGENRISQNYNVYAIK